jgi:hypothetical protein
MYRTVLPILCVGRELIPLPPNSCTKVVAREVLEHVREPERLLPEMVRVDVDGAQYLSTVPDVSSEELLAVVAPPVLLQEPKPHSCLRQRPNADDPRRLARCC